MSIDRAVPCSNMFKHLFSAGRTGGFARNWGISLFLYGHVKRKKVKKHLASEGLGVRSLTQHSSVPQWLSCTNPPHFHLFHLFSWLHHVASIHFSNRYFQREAWHHMTPSVLEHFPAPKVGQLRRSKLGIPYRWPSPGSMRSGNSSSSTVISIEISVPIELICVIQNCP